MQAVSPKRTETEILVFVFVFADKQSIIPKPHML